MSFLFPIFLLAGLSLAIPVFIHLFNLRRYKTVFFPHTRFLRNIQLRSQKQSQLRYKWLLLARLIFLAALILAFAQPFFNKNENSNAGRVQVIYIDNSASMSIKKGAQSLLEMAKTTAGRQVHQSAPGTKFLLLTNDKPVFYQPVNADKIKDAIRQIDFSYASRNSEQVLTSLQSMIQNESAKADLYYYSDFQKDAFLASNSTIPEPVRFYGIPLQAEVPANVYIDTAFLTIPVLQVGMPNKMIVHTKAAGEIKENPVLQLAVNGQLKTAASLLFNGEKESIDTLSFTVSETGWQKILLVINDASLRFDDTFRMAARSSSDLSVLVLNESQPNPYIQAAFRAYNGFRMDQFLVSNAPEDWKKYNLVILNGITQSNVAFADKIALALQSGQSICLFPGKTNNIAMLNELLGKLGDIRITGLDTAVQVVSSLQEGSDLVKDIFERIPENIQLPVAKWHYNIFSGLSANQRSVLSFRNGEPFFAQYNPSRGKLYISATSPDLVSGNFPGSYFFVPFLYQMTLQSKAADVFAFTVGKEGALYLPLSDAGERNVLHLYSSDMDIIPPQRPSGAGVDVIVGQAVQRPGFYTLAGKTGDSLTVAMNQDRAESRLDLWNIESLEKDWNGQNIHWKSVSDATGNDSNSDDSFPLWKVCVILALIMLAVETFMLTASLRKQPLATQAS